MPTEFSLFFLIMINKTQKTHREFIFRQICQQHGSRLNGYSLERVDTASSMDKWIQYRTTDF